MSKDKMKGKIQGLSRNSHDVKILISDYYRQDLHGLLIMAKSIERMAGWLRGLEPPKQKKLLILCKFTSAECHNRKKILLLFKKKKTENLSNLECKTSQFLKLCTPQNKIKSKL